MSEYREQLGVGLGMKRAKLAGKQWRSKPESTDYYLGFARKVCIVIKAWFDR